MSHTEEDSSEPLISVARAVRTRGLKGEVVAELLTDFPERFEAIDELIGVAPDGSRQKFAIDDYWFQNDRVVLKLAGYDDVDKAAELVGYEFAVPETDRVQLADDEYYDWELEGCTVKVVGGVVIGKVQSVLKTGGTEILEVADEAGNERLVPLAASIVVEISTTEKTIVIDPPEGLLDL
jgi:16S rRNA processing protein RimM